MALELHWQQAQMVTMMLKAFGTYMNGRLLGHHFGLELSTL